MKKLNLDALKERAEAIASEELLGTISGGLMNSCHISTNPNDGPIGDGDGPYVGPWGGK